MAHTIIGHIAPALPALGASILCLAPIAAGALAVACLVYERGRNDEQRGAMPALAAIVALGAYLVVLPTDADNATLALAAATAVALWLHARVRRHRRLRPLWWLLASCLVGARPLLLAPLLPMCIVTLAASVRDTRRSSSRGRRDARAKWSQLALVVGLGFALGRVFLAPGLAPGLAAPIATPQAASHWLYATVHGAGIAALVLGGLALALALVGEGRRQLGLVAALLLAVEAAVGQATPLTALALALALALGLLEVEARLEAGTQRGWPLPGASLMLAPLMLVALLEPLAARIGSAHLHMPTLGPIPPGKSDASGRPRIR